MKSHESLPLPQATHFNSTTLSIQENESICERLDCIAARQVTLYEGDRSGTLLTYPTGMSIHVTQILARFLDSMGLWVRKLCLIVCKRLGPGRVTQVACPRTGGNKRQYGTKGDIRRLRVGQITIHLVMISSELLGEACNP